MGLDVIVLFFLLGIAATLIGSDLKLPNGLSQGVSIFLMLAIGLKGGVALSVHLSPDIIVKAGVVMLMGFVLPLIAYPLLRFAGCFAKSDAASIAAHFGSVSIGTFAVAVALLESQDIAYEAYFPVFVVLLEFPAILVAALIANQQLSRHRLFTVAKEIFTNQSIVLLFGGLLIGLVGGSQTQKIMPLFNDLFYGVLAIFLLDMGMTAARKIRPLKNNGSFLIAFGIALPLVNGLIGAALASVIGLSTGGVFLMIVLAASASYIAVPMAMKTLVPEANPALGLSTSLGVTFPFNVIAGLPVYWVVASWMTI